MTKKAFVTGGTGFVGLHIVEQLARGGWQVTALHRASSDTSRLRTLDVRLVEGSIDDPASLARAMPEDCDAVFHVAGNTSFWSGHKARQTRENVDGTRHMVETALARGARCFVHTSSIAAYGEQTAIPYDETAVSTAATSSINYERTKFLGEEEVRRGVARGLRAVILNPANILGPYDLHNWARMITLVETGKLPGIPPGGGSFCAAEEVARAHIAAVDRGRSGENYILGGTDATMHEFIRIIADVTGKKVPSRPVPLAMFRVLGRVGEWTSRFTNKPPVVTPEIATLTGRKAQLVRSAKAERELGFVAVPLRTMVQATYDWLSREGLLTATSMPS